MTESAALCGSGSRPTEAGGPERRGTVLLLACSEPEWRLVASARSRARLPRSGGPRASPRRSPISAKPCRISSYSQATLRGSSFSIDYATTNGWDSVSAIVLTLAGDLAAMADAFDAGADDVVPYSARRGELAARMRALLERRAVLRADMLRDPTTGALTEESLAPRCGMSPSGFG